MFKYEGRPPRKNLAMALRRKNSLGGQQLMIVSNVLYLFIGREWRSERRVDKYLTDLTTSPKSYSRAIARVEEQRGK